MAHKDPIRKAAYMKQWYADHPEYSKQKYHALSPEKKAEYLAKSRDKYRDESGPTRRATAKKSRMKVKAEVIAAYGKVCQCCDEDQIEFLTIDHIHGGGKKHVESLNVGRGFQFYAYLRANHFPDKDKLRVLCMNCNFALGIIGYCPHQRPRFVPDALTSELSADVTIN
jgi:hypothetical protein